MITNFKLFERIGEIDPPLNIGNSVKDGMQGVYIGENRYDDLPFIINLFEEKNIKFRLLYKEHMFLILIPNNDDVKKLPCTINKGYKDFRIPFRDGKSFGIGWFYQFTIDTDHWLEIFINSEDDVEELKAMISANKYNL